jgi:hypothetical protein
MASVNVILSYALEDADGDRASLPIYGRFDDATATLSSLEAYLAATAADLDAITDVKIIGQALTIVPTLPSGLKADAVDGSDVEKTGLITYALHDPSNKSYGQDIPGFFQAGFVGDVIDQTDTNVAQWITRNLTAGTVLHLNDLWSTYFTAVRRAVKSFRKLGRRS